MMIIDVLHKFTMYPFAIIAQNSLYLHMYAHWLDGFFLLHVNYDI